MLSRARILAVAALAVAMTATTFKLPRTKAAPSSCDNKCRYRFDFYQCNAASDKCIYSTKSTCLYCVYGGSCKDNADALLNPFGG